MAHLILGWICLVAGAYATWRSLRAIARGLLSRKWPATQGTVRKAKWTESTNSENDPTWRLDIDYAYQVKGGKFRGKRVRFGLPSGMGYDRPDDLRPGDRVNVVYNPARPSVSALRRGAHPFAIIPLIVGGGLLWVGLLAVIR